MGLKRFVIDGYGQVELNQVAFRRDGRIEAQCALGDDFNDVSAENGMLLSVNNVKRVVNFPKSDEIYPVALNYTTEHMYDERANGLKDFKLDKGEFLPRLGYLAVGDKFTTNCLCYDDAEFASDEALIEAYAAVETTPLYGTVSTMGAIKVTKTKPSAGVVLLAVLGTGAGSMPDGQFGMKFHVAAV
jgi:hypothetical protein